MPDGVTLLDRAIAAQRDLLRGYERPSEPLALETLRTLDHVFCRELFPEPDIGDVSPEEAAIMSAGGNHALRRILPRKLGADPFRLFPSTAETQAKADGFVLDCGVLELAERQAAFLREGLLFSDVRPVDPNHFPSPGADHILVLKAASASAYAESIGRRGQRWASAEVTRTDSENEGELERRHVVLLPALDAAVRSVGQHYMEYEVTTEISVHFWDWAELYLRRMPHQDMIGSDELIGGRRFSDYVAVLTALSSRAQMQLCFAGILKHRLPKLTFRNLLTAFGAFSDLLEDIAGAIGSDTLEAQRLLTHLTLDPFSHSEHLDRADPAWAPVIRSSANFCLLPVFGLDINPYLFLLNDLRTRYKEDWFRLANTREARWLGELEAMFPSDRWAINLKNLKLKKDGKTTTDIDFAVQDRLSGDIALFQLKWQQPVLADPAIRRSNASNLLTQSNAWIAAVRDWIAEFGVPELCRRLAFPCHEPKQVTVFVLARYAAHFAGRGGRDGTALWSDWAHFRKAHQAAPASPLPDLASRLAAEITAAEAEIRPQSVALPLPGLAVILNPATEPERSSSASQSAHDGS